MASKIPARHVQQAKRDLDMRDKLVNHASLLVHNVLVRSIDGVYSHYARTGKYKDPDLSQMQVIFTNFYKSLLKSAYTSCERHRMPVKKLAALPEPDLPDGPKAIRKAIKPNSKFYKELLKRSAKLYGAAKKSFLKKFQREFAKLIPKLETTNLAPAQIKQEIKKAWGLETAPARVNVIFQTESTKYFAQAQINYFQDSDDIIGYMYSSVRDTSRTPICKCREGMVLAAGSAELKHNMPPLHYNCRSALTPLADDAQNRALMKESARQPSSRPLKQYPPLAGFGEG